MSSKLVFLIKFLLSKLLRISFLCFYVPFISLFVLAYFWREVTLFSNSQLQNTRYFQYFLLTFILIAISLPFAFNLLCTFQVMNQDKSPISLWITPFFNLSLFLSSLSQITYITPLSPGYLISTPLRLKRQVYVQRKSKLL